MKIDHRLSDAQCDALTKQLQAEREAYRAEDNYVGVGAMERALQLLHQARTDAFHALVKRKEARMPKTLFGKPTHS